MNRKKLIIDVGAGDGSFVERLRKGNTKEIRGIDREPKKAGIIKDYLGSHFLNMSKEEAERLHAIWINHVELTSLEAHAELKILAEKIPKKVPVIITVRQERLLPTINSIRGAGLKIVGQIPVTEKMVISEFTRKFLEESKRNPEKKSIRIIAVKP
jgi:precorrin-6B methylase 2